MPRVEFDCTAVMQVVLHVMRLAPIQMKNIRTNYFPSGCFLTCGFSYRSRMLWGLQSQQKTETWARSKSYPKEHQNKSRL